MVYSPDYYRDCLRISRNSISYKRKNIFTGLETAKWSHRLRNENYLDSFSFLCDKITDLIEENLKYSSSIIRTDCGSYSIKVVYLDGTTDELEYTSDFVSNDMEEIADAIISMVPRGELFPDLLDHDYLHHVNVKKLDSVLKHLEQNIKIEWKEPVHDEGVVMLPFPDYPMWTDDIFKLITPDYSYDAAVDYIRKNRITPEQMSYRDIRATITMYERSERICDGCIASAIESGYMRRILLRLKELVKEAKKARLI